jgi:hypothetical protein
MPVFPQTEKDNDQFPKKEKEKENKVVLNISKLNLKKTPKSY